MKNMSMFVARVYKKKQESGRNFPNGLCDCYLGNCSSCGQLRISNLFEAYTHTCLYMCL